MRRFFFTILFTAAISAAHAAEAPVEKKIPAGLTINECLLILNSLNAMDEHIVIIGKEPNQQTVKQSYEYGPGGFRINFLAHNMHILTAVQQDAQAEQQRILRDILVKMPSKEDGKPVTEIPPGTPEALDYDRRLRDLTGSPCIADLTHFRDSDLHLEKNELPGWAIGNIEKLRDK